MSPARSFVSDKWNEMNRALGHLCAHIGSAGQDNLLRWKRWHCPADTGFEPWLSEAEHATSRSQRLPTMSWGQCHLTHLTILRRFSWPNLADMCTKVADWFYLPPGLSIGAAPFGFVKQAIMVPPNDTKSIYILNVLIRIVKRSKKYLFSFLKGNVTSLSPHPMKIFHQKCF